MNKGIPRSEISIYEKLCETGSVERTDKNCFECLYETYKFTNDSFNSINNKNVF